jgi:glycosyltransferase involved in cell wall biosynthesis
MKIAYVSTYLPQRCGLATYLDYLVQGIKAVDEGVKIKIIAEQGAAPVKREGFEVVPCWSRKENYIKSILEQARGADLVHVQHEYSIYGFDDRLPSLLEKLNAKKVVTIHCIRPSQVSERGDVDELYARRLARLANSVIVHLPSQKEILLRLGILSEKVHVLPHGTKVINIDVTGARRRLGLPLRGKILLMFGFVKPHKCAHVVLDALSEVQKEVEDVYLFIAGGLAPSASEREREYVGQLRAGIKELGLEGRVLLPLKFFPSEDVPYVFGASDLVLFPYYEDDRSSSGSLHLALGAGKPVVASRIPKFEELRNICDELLILPHSPQRLAKVVTRLFKDRAFAQHVLKRIYEYRKETSWEAIARKHLTLYENMI